MNQVNDKTIAMLEFDALLKRILIYATSERAKDDLTNITPFSTYEQLEAALKQLDEMFTLIVKYGEIPFGVSTNLTPYLQYAVKGGLLNIKQLDEIAEDINYARRIKEFLKELPSEFPLLIALVSEFSNLNEVEKAIRKVILPDLSINNHASRELFKIRQKITRHEGKINEVLTRLLDKYTDLLTEKIITIREGHYVLPIKTSLKNKLSGTAYALSDSGATTFIEPKEIATLNAELTALRFEEIEEINRLLRYLSELVAKHESEIQSNNIIIGELDFIHAKAKYALEIDGYIAKTTFDQHLHLPNAKHPLIPKETCVPNTFTLTNKDRIMVISGPNAGGKTVALKTVGLLVYMHHLGLALPTSEQGAVPFIKRLFVDIGDSQSLRDNLSTFSGHLENLKQLSADLDENDLVIIDELGTGTDPNEGAALATALTNYVLESKALGLISSHYSQLKDYALVTDGVFNASMLFNDDLLSPTYKLKMYAPGKSYGLVVARRYGLNEQIITHAEMLLKQSLDQKTNETYIALEKEIAKNIALNEQLEFETKKLTEAQDELESAKAKYEKERKSLSEQYLEQARLYKLEAEQKVLEAIEAIKNAQKPHEIIAAKSSITQMDLIDEEVIYINEEKSGEDFKVGDSVYIQEMNLYGEIKRIQGKRISVTATNGINITTSLNKLSHAHIPSSPKKAEQQQRKGIRIHHSADSVGLELNVIGLRVDEALTKVSRYLDDCRLKNFQTVKIIHGSGSGALRSAIHDYLAKQGDIASFELAPLSEGGYGATVVKLYD